MNEEVHMTRCAAVSYLFVFISSAYCELDKTVGALFSWDKTNKVIVVVVRESRLKSG